MSSEHNRDYARVIIRSGVALREGQKLRIMTEVVNSYFARMLAEEAYDAGASYVSIVYSDTQLERIRLDCTRAGDSLEIVPSWNTAMYEELLDQDWATISLRGPENPDVLEGADTGKLGRLRRAQASSRRIFSEGIASNRISWNVCLWPTRTWARKVLTEDLPDWEERIWEVLTPVLRLDCDDPAAAWLEHDSELKRRAAYLNGKAYSAFRFRGPGTDLTVGMRVDRTWAGGSCVSRSGSRFFPNIPTEEVFSTPDRAATEGTVRCTRPVEVMGSRVEGAWFRFSSGRVSEFGADSNPEVLGKFLEIEDSARFVGEIALVGIDSPIFRSGLVFHNTLFDENAACHIALGNGYRDCITGGTEMDRASLDATGCNVSLVHVDFMIGSGEVSVSGVDTDGREEAVIRDGVFVV